MKLQLILIMSILMLSMVCAGSYEQPIKQGETFDLVQTCSDCTWIEYKTMKYPNGTLTSMYKNMTSVGGVWKYPFGNTTQLGTYEFYSCGDEFNQATATRVINCETISFEVTPSGEGGLSNMVFFVFIIIAIYAINLFGFFGRNIPMTILGGMALIFLGIYLITNGVIIYRDNLTNYFAYVTIAWGFISAMFAGIELLQDM